MEFDEFVNGLKASGKRFVEDKVPDDVARDFLKMTQEDIPTLTMTFAILAQKQTDLQSSALAKIYGNIAPIISVVAYLMQRTDALTAEIASLKGRIARLEGGETHVDGSQKTE